MEKVAQNRGILNKLREHTNITGRILESVNPEFAALLDNLRATDEKIRSHASELKALARSAKSLVNRRDYLSAAVNFSAFHERCRHIANELDKFNKSVDLKHYKFLLDQFDDEQKQQLFGYDPSKELKEDEDNVNDDIFASIDTSFALQKQAGMSDWWFKAKLMTDPIGDVAHNLMTERGVAMRALEKRFSIAFLKDLKVSSIGMINKTLRFLSFLLSNFKKLAMSLAKRNVDQYISNAKSFIVRFADFHKEFVKFYDKNIVPLKAQHEKVMQIDQAKKDEDMAQKAKELQEYRAQKEKEMGVIDEEMKFRQQQKMQEEMKGQEFEQQMKEKLHQGVEQPTTNTATEPTRYREKMKKRWEDPNLKYPPGNDPNNIPINLVNKKEKSAQEFIDGLKKIAANDDAQSFALEVLAYSEAIENDNPNASVRLIAIAENVINDHKTAGIFDLFKKKDDDEPEEDEHLSFPPKDHRKPFEHGIPEGDVNKKFNQFPSLKSITPDKIRLTSGAAEHVFSMFIKRLYDFGMDPGRVDSVLARRVLDEIRQAVVRGIIISNHVSDDSNNPLDRQFKIYSYVKLDSISPSLEGVAKLFIFVRLSLANGTMSVRTIQKNFQIG